MIGFGESAQAYAAYIRSPEWQEKRHARLQHDGFRCTGCGSDGSDSRLEVHHLTYDRFGTERIEDLMTLCHLCHCREHGRAPTYGVMPVDKPSRQELEERASLIEQQRLAIRQAERTQMSRVDRIRELEERAKAGNKHAKRQLFVIDQRLDKAERQANSD